MNKLPNDIEEIKMEIDIISRQIYVDYYLDMQAISAIPLQLLNLYLYRSMFVAKLRKMIVVTTGLIQLGLDMHDQVMNNQEIIHDRITKRQIQILAGDYYSSICYQIMAKEDYTMHVRKLAKGITENSAAKMQLYDFNNENNFKSSQELVGLLKTREAALYVEFLTGDLEQTEQKAWQKIVENTILLSQISAQLKLETIEDNTLAFYLIRSFANNTEMTALYQSTDTGEFQKKVKYLYNSYEIKEKIIDIKNRLEEEIYEMIELVQTPIIQRELCRLVKEAKMAMQ